ncbi:MAG TPA: sugar phosphate nucleotidyltransferase [Acidimicrobiales bacterium]|nr:sugar phosphate nucleotidyltransferase [Acidimicrobiales bacterium]
MRDAAIGQIECITSSSSSREREIHLIRKAVIAAAGLGTRFLPQTKAMPKEMLPILDKPIIQYIVEELVEAGIEDIVIVTGYHKRSIEDHFAEPSQELVVALKGPKRRLLKEVEHIANLANFAYMRQKGPNGNGTPLLNAAHLIGDEPFIYTFGDDFIRATPGRFSQMVALHERTGLGVLSCIRADDDDDYTRYGYVGGKEIEPGILKIESIVEKPGRSNAPSDLASVSSYLFTPTILGCLSERASELGPGEELSLQDAMQLSIDDGNFLLGYEIENARYFDTGDKLEYLKTIIDLGLEDEHLGPALRAHFTQSLGSQGPSTNRGGGNPRRAGLPRTK